MLKGPFARPKSFTSPPLISPLLGFNNITHEIATSIGGKMLGMIAVSSKSRRNGALVRIVIHASVNAKTTERPDAPRPKIKELRSSG